MTKNPGVTPAISVTMAAFNVASYVAASIESVLAQDWANFELIVVDDASTDGTREILQKYAARDPRVRLFMKDRNEGLAEARNLGIAKARGEWVTFLDTDDLFDPRMLRLGIEAGSAQSAGMVMWDYAVFASETELPARQAEPSLLRNLDPSDRYALLDLPAFGWTRLVRRDELARLAISFPRGLTYQDVPVHWRLVTEVERIAIVPRRLSFYRQQPNATTAGKGLKRADFFIVLDQVEDHLRKNRLFDTYADSLTARQLNAWYGVFDIIAAEHKPHVHSLIAERLTDRHRAYLASDKPMRWQARAFFRGLDGDWRAALALRVRGVLRSFYRTVKGST
jgi:glycosyltransferase involved in cell wall biosynthesis